MLWTLTICSSIMLFSVAGAASLREFFRAQREFHKKRGGY